MSIVIVDQSEHIVTLTRPIVTARVVVEGPQGPPGDSMWEDDGDGGASIDGDVVIEGDLIVDGVPINPWVQLTQAEYDALPIKDPNTLYVIVG